MKLNTRLEQFILLWVPVLVWMVAIFTMSNRPAIQTSTSDSLDFVIKKIAHLTEYAILLILAFRALYRSWGKKNNVDVLENLAIVISLTYAVSDELHQSFISGRMSTVRDVLIDFIGILIGLGIIKLLKSSKRLHIVRYVIYGK